MTYLHRHGTGIKLYDRLPSHTRIVVCIPVLDEPELPRTLQSLEQAQRQAHVGVEVLVLFNYSESAPPKLKARQQSHFKEIVCTAERWRGDGFGVQFALRELPARQAGVGLARKLLMDEAYRLLMLAGNTDTIIATTDADTVVAPNYFTALTHYFRTRKKTEAASIYFEHILPPEGPEREAIVAYELHLRYFIQAQRDAGSPTAYHTIGSAMAVRPEAYAREGGMNRRQAGEDFYFLQKFARKRTLGELNTTAVFPSGRRSDRVPFGTGKAVAGYLDGDRSFHTYHPAIFADLKPLFQKIREGYRAEDADGLRIFGASLPAAVRDFLSRQKFEDRIREIRQHTASAAAFEKRFFRWFDGFMTMKYTHFARDRYYGTMPVVEAAQAIARQHGYTGAPATGTLLHFFRHLQRQSRYPARSGARS